MSSFDLYRQAIARMVRVAAGRLEQHALALTITAGILLFLAALATVIAALLLRRHREHQLAAGARTVTILAPPTVDATGAEALWSNLAGLARPSWPGRLVTGQPYLTWEYVIDSDGLRIQLWISGGVPRGLVERAIEAAWPGSRATRTATAPPADDRPPPPCVGGELRLARAEALPIRVEHPTDPLRAVLGALGGLRHGERAVVQILARPATANRVHRARRAARRPDGASSPTMPGRGLDLLQAIVTPGRSPRTRRSSAEPDHQVRLLHGAEDRAVVAKGHGPHYETLVRYAITVDPPTSPVSPSAPPEKDKAGQIRGRLQGRASALVAAFTGYTAHNHYRPRELADPSRALAVRQLRGGDLLSVTELAALAHLPLDADIPGLPRARAKAVPPTPAIPSVGAAVRRLGVADTGSRRPVGLGVADGRHHVHILGATGAGKSELLARMTLDDVHAGRGVVNIDPKGDQIHDILARLPRRVADKVLLLDADTSSRPPCLNPLDQPDRIRAADNLTAILARIYAASWGPRTEDITRAGLLTLAAQPGTSRLTDLPKLLESAAFRDRALRQVDDDILLGFWHWYDQLTDAARATAVAPLMNKLRGLLLHPFIRQAISAGPTTVPMDDILDHGGICLVRATQDTLGTDTATLLGSLVVATVWQAATRRARQPQAQRADATLYLDEAHNFLHLPYPLDAMLAAARGLRLSIVLAHQHLAQLPKHLEEAIATNARNKIYFATSPADAQRLLPHVAPRVSAHDLAHLDAFHIAARLVVQGADSDAFTAITEPLPPPIPGRADEIRAAARQRVTPSDPAGGAQPSGS